MISKSYTVTKTQIECVKIAGTDDSWAMFTIDYIGNGGRITIASDCGNWSHSWRGAGKSFKAFLISLDIEYFAGKVGERNWFDQNKSIDELKARVIELIETRDERKQLFFEIKKLDDHKTKDQFIMACFASDSLHKLWEAGPDIVTGISPSFKRFWADLWSVYIELLKNEIAGEVFPSNIIRRK